MSIHEKISFGLADAGLGQLKNAKLLTSGDWASVYKIDLESGKSLAVKVGHPGHEGLMAGEAAMLGYLARVTTIPFPKVLGCSEGLLFLSFINNDGRKGEGGAAEAGRALANLHNHSSETFGFKENTIFGPTPQPNPEMKSWIEFFGQHRLLYMGRIAFEAGQISSPLFSSLESFIGNLENFLPADSKPALLHGDFWGGNILFHQGHLAAFIDPAIFYGDQEVDLAFSTLFGSMGEPFFEAYRGIRPIQPDFSERVDIYNLWGLLFHAYWFGGGYAKTVEQILRRFGY